MNRALTGRPGAPVAAADGHPDWCARAHHCAADRGGQHASVPEVWDTDQGRYVATRHRDRRGRDHVELRVVLRLADDDATAQAQARHLLAVTYQVVERVFASDRRKDSAS
ncbi:hypothetical protein Cs7R123_06450 [Catellatospora sp. TT07R-123]|uniref:hypothetical protein n=1 Tax=Catellatospora sp. TT07R-123 TaxID=2733863 RepID=UPI001B2A3E80|nr:hypothetical protein [Catellatospora sp. TT07R-123]GHJ43303.1 hypothetical protein Cs7R123_06450 [Catellatospora sp. TT07R-123]